MRRLNSALVGTRRDPVVLLALAVERDEPAFSPTLLRTAADRSARIYLLPGLHPFHRPGVIAANPHLALPRGCVRICWPQLNADSDPYDHPLICRREDESERDVLERFARAFDLSRPRVRREIKLIESARASSEIELEHTTARLIDAERQLHDKQSAPDKPTFLSTGDRSEGCPARGQGEACQI